MKTKSKLPPSADIWIGWSHLISPFDRLGDPAAANDRIDPATLSPENERLFAAIFHYEPALLATGTRGFTLSVGKVDELDTRILNAAPPGRTFVPRRRFLEVIEAGNATGRFDRIPLPHLPAPAPPNPPSPFLPEKFERMLALQPMIDAFVESLADTSALAADARWGRVMLSAMVFGALLNPRLVMGLPEAIASADQELLWLMLIMDARDEPTEASSADEASSLPQEIGRRWYPDPITRLLLLRERGHLPQIPPGRMSRAGAQVFLFIRAYARAQGFEALLPRHMSALREGLETRLSLNLPPWLVSYAAERLQSTSLPEWSMQRLLNPPVSITPFLTPRQQAEAADLPKGSGESLEEDADQEDEWPSQLRELGRIVKDRTRKTREVRQRLQEWLAANHATLIPSVRLIGEWAANVLLKKTVKRQSLKPQTVYQKVRRIAGRLAGQLGCTDLSRIDCVDTFAEIYLNVLEDAPSTNARRKAAIELKSFHDYLADAYDQVPSLEGSGVFNVSGYGAGFVDANVVTLDTFYRALKWLDEEAVKTYGTEVATQLGLIARLGFFAGLRRSEALGLTVGAFQTCRVGGVTHQTSEIWLEIALNSLRDVKTQAGRRNLPLSVLMDETGLRKLRNWLKSRLAHSCDPQSPLFPAFIRNGTLKQTDSRLKLIADALRHAADDESLRYHHLRHSFATWISLLLWLGEENDPGILPDWFVPTEHDRARFREAGRIRSALLGLAPTSRRGMLSVSGLMGHSGLDVTMESYIHLADFMLGRMALRLVEDVPLRVLVALSGFSERHVRNCLMDKPGATEPASFSYGGRDIERLADRVALEGRMARERQLVPRLAVGQIGIATPQDPFLWLLHLAEALRELGQPNASLDNVAQRFGLPSQKLGRWKARLATLPKGLLADGRRNRVCRGSGAGQPRDPINLPEGPARDLAQKTAEAIVSLLRQGNLRQVGRAAATQRLNRVASRFPTMWVPDSLLVVVADSVHDARGWLWFLEEIGMADDVTIELCCSRGPGADAPEKQRSYWVDKLGRRIEVSKQRVNGRPRLTMALDASKLGGQRSRVVNQVLYGVRFLLAMLGITRGSWASFNSLRQSP